MDKMEIKQACMNLIKNNIIANISYIDGEGYPNIKAMIVLKHSEITHFWFFTHTHSAKMKQLKKNPKAALYIQDFVHHHGLLLLGQVAVVNDEEIKKSLWQDSFKIFFSEGISDPQLITILRFDAVKGNYYDSKNSYDFLIP